MVFVSKLLSMNRNIKIIIFINQDTLLNESLPLVSFQDEFEEREDELLQGGDAYILVYSITNRRSFKKANELRFKLQRTQATEMVPIILVGNKTDLERSREVPFEGTK